MITTALDLFCGAGGLSLGLQDAGFEIVAAVDNCGPAMASYAKNFEHPSYKEDIKTIGAITLKKWGIRQPIDLIAGGPPCQGFSIQRIGEDADERNDLVFEFGRIICEIRPRMFLMENVPGLLGKRGVNAVKRFTKLMIDAGYILTHEVLDAVNFGVPQFRRRVFYVGWQRDQDINFSFPNASHSEKRYQTVRKAIGDLASPPHDFSPYPGDPLHRRMKLSRKNLERLALIPPGGGFEDLPREMRVDCHRDGADKIGHRSVYGRLDANRPAGTITARFDSFTRGRFAHPWEDRNISLREGARLQGFDDKYVFLGTQEEIAAQIGNAVPPPLAAAVCRQIFEALASKHAKIQQSALPSRGRQAKRVA